MVCKKCGKEFTSENNICPFCNEDNTVAETPVATSDAQPEVTNETPVDPEVTTQQPETTETKPTEEATPEIEDLFDEPKKEEPAKEELVIEEPKTSEAAPTTETAPVVTDATQTETPVETPVATPEASVETPVAPEATPTTPTAEVKEEPAPTTEVAPATDATTAAPETQPAKKSNGKTILLLLVVVALIIVVVIMYLPKDEEEAGNTDTNNTPTTNETTNNENNNNETNNNNNNTTPETTSSISDLLAFSGVYENGNVSITIYAVGSDSVSFSVVSDNGIEMQNLELDANKNLFLEDDSFGETTSIKVEKTADGIKVTASSSDTESALNSINNTYTKKATITSTWSGLYKNGDVEFVIDEYTTGTLALNYADNKNYIFGQYGNIEDYTETTINYVSEFFDETTTITITKTTDGIQVVATSTDPEEDLTTLNGTFTKMN